MKTAQRKKRGMNLAERKERGVISRGKISAFVLAYNRKQDGFGPTLEEIGNSPNVNLSVSVVHNHVDILVELGVLTVSVTQSGQRRSGTLRHADYKSA